MSNQQKALFSEELDSRKRGSASGSAIVFLESRIPDPNIGAGNQTVVQHLQILSSLGYTIYFHPMSDTQSETNQAIFNIDGVSVLRSRQKLGLLFGLLDPQADFVWIARPEVAEHFIPMVRSLTDARIIYYTHDLHFRRMQLESTYKGSPQIMREANQMMEIEQEIFDSVDMIFSPNSDETRTIQRMSPDTRAHTVPAFFFHSQEIGIRTSKSFKSNKSLVFLGGFAHNPNVDAVQFLVSRILPLIWDEDPNVTLYIAGSDMPQEIGNLSLPNVEVLGQIDSIDELFARCRIFVAPLFYGAGVKGKVVQALRCGLPIVASNIAAEGIDWGKYGAGEVYSRPEEFAEATINLLRDHDACHRLSVDGVDIITSSFTFEIAQERFASLLSRFPRARDLNE